MLALIIGAVITFFILSAICGAIADFFNEK